MKNCTSKILIYALLITASAIAAQPCITQTGALFGTIEGNESAYVLADSPDGSGFYVGGYKDDSTLIVKMDYQGLVLWSRTFNIIPGEDENLRCMIVDSDGNLVFGGLTGGSHDDGGTIYLGKYDPGGDNIIWAKELTTDWTTNWLFDLREKGPGGNYILSTNPLSGGVNVAEILEITRSNGSLITSASKMFQHGNNAQLSKLLLHNGSIFGVGRYTSGNGLTRFRNTITRLNANTYDPIWTGMGHIGPNGTARLYGQDLLIFNDEIYSSYHGDPAGTNYANTKVYMQKTDLDGNVMWIKQYDFPGNNEVSIELIDSDGGMVMLAMKRIAPNDIMMMKIDYSGSVLWAKNYQIEDVSNVDTYIYGQQLLIEAGGYLIFSALGTTTSAGGEMIIIRTDLDGNVITPCVTALPIAVPVINIPPLFYHVTPTMPVAPMTEDEPFTEPVIAAIQPNAQCIIADTIFEFVAETICEGEVFEGYTIPGTYIDYFTAQNGCDSVRTLDLSQYPLSGSAEQISICLGQSYGGYTATGLYTETHTNMFGCDSVYSLDLTVTALENEIDLTICSGEEFQGYTESGFYVDTLQGPPLDCDTVQSLTLTVAEIVLTTLNATICEGESFEGYSVSGTYIDDFVSVQGCDSIRTLVLTVNEEFATSIEASICDGVSFEGYSVSGTYIDNFVSEHGCDSIRTLVLTVTDVISTSIDALICDGDSFEGYSMPGTYIDDFVSEHGCDSIRTLVLTVTDVISTSIDAVICEGDSFEGYSVSGTYIDDFVSEHGCDSNRTLVLTVTDVISTSIDAVICEGESFEGYSTSGMYVDDFVTGHGCDSIRTLVLAVNPIDQTAVTITVCEGESHQGYFIPGIYEDAFTNIQGCDSVRILTLMVNDTIQTSFAVGLCAGEFYEGYSAPGVFTDTFTAAAGCDSIRTVTLVEVMPTQTLDIELCAGLEYDGHTQTGSYIDTLQGANGACDTVRYLELFIHLPLLTFINAAICEGDTFLGYSETGLHTDTLLSVDGCDSVRMVQLTIQNILSTTEQVTICDGESYEGYSLPGIYVDTFLTTSGCDSIRQLELIVDMPQLNLEVTICEGTSYLGYTSSGVFTDVLPGNPGECDTMRTLTLVVTNVLVSFINASVCAGEQFEGYSTSGNYVDTFFTNSGCDSIRTLDLTVNEIAMTSLDHSICHGEIYEGYDTDGVYVDTLQAITGCDSIRTLNLTVGIIKQLMEETICNSESYETYTLPGVYIDTISAIGGLCDTLRTLTLRVKNIARTTIDQVICDGDSYAGYSQTGMFIDTLISAEGCDSIREINLEKLDPIQSMLMASSCNLSNPLTLPAGLYIDTLVSARGCDSVRTIIVEGASLYIPNVFSPNNDGINDVFTISAFPSIELDLAYFAIFDRFGDMTYETVSWPIAWTGDDETGNPFQPGVFAYIMIYYCGNQKQVEYGNITLVK